MANITERKNKDGSTSYLIRAFVAESKGGKQKVRSMTWRPPAGMTERQIQKELSRQAMLFEDLARAGSTAADGSIKFSAFAEKWYSEFAEKQLKIKTYTEYKKLFPRIFAAIGHIKLKDLKTGHLNAFYANLQEHGINANAGQKVVGNGKLAAVMQGRSLSQYKVAEMSGVSSSTVNAVCKGETVALKSAEAIANALKVNFDEVFTVKDSPDTLSPATVRMYHRLISSILTKAVKWGYIPASPAANAELPRPAKAEAHYLDKADACKLLELLQDENIKYRTMITLDLLSGLRRGELLGLRWRDIDFENDTIRVNQTSSYASGSGLYTDTPKNDTSSRPLRLSHSAFVLLRHYQAWQDDNKQKCGDIWQNTDDRIFTNEDGSPIFPDTITKWFTKFVKHSGLPSVTIHSLRHTYASLMIANGTPLVVVSKRLGHAQVSTTSNIYSHLIQSADEKAAQITDMFDSVILKAPVEDKPKEA